MLTEMLLLRREGAKILKFYFDFYIESSLTLTKLLLRTGLCGCDNVLANRDDFLTQLTQL
jgi:hypothetical protein